LQIADRQLSIGDCRSTDCRLTDCRLTNAHATDKCANRQSAIRRSPVFNPSIASLQFVDRQSAIANRRSAICNLQSAMTEAEYCRAIENYLCRKNEGHLIRIVGPVFEQVSGWAAQGVPLALAYRGIDQYCERYYAKGPRRRPVRIEFCEADILSLFDDWRRAVGVGSAAGDEAGPAKRDTLPAHIDRVLSRLAAIRPRVSADLAAQLDTAVRELEETRGTAAHARGEARAALLARLAVLDAEILRAARQELDDARTRELAAAAAADIAPFASRMSAEARMHAVEAAFERLLRDTVGLPNLVHEP
jgi:hypothetical protein